MRTASVKRHTRRTKKGSVPVKQHKRKLPNKVGKYKVKYVGTNVLKDYAGMNHYAGKAMGFKPLPDKNTVLVAKDMKFKTKLATINHEIEEAELMKKGKKYWDSHQVALKGEKELAFLNRGAGPKKEKMVVRECDTCFTLVKVPENDWDGSCPACFGGQLRNTKKRTWKTIKEELGIKNMGMAFDINKETGYPIANYPESFGKTGKRKLIDPLTIIDLARGDMSREDFIARIKRTKGGDESKTTVDEFKELIKSDKKILPPAVLEYKKGEPFFWEGVHRAVAAYELGVKLPIIEIKEKKNRGISVSKIPKVTLYHGTREKFLPDIKKEGLKIGKGMYEKEDKYVYLSPSAGVALGHAFTGPEDKAKELSKNKKKFGERGEVLLKVTIPTDWLREKDKKLDTKDFWGTYQVKVTKDIPSKNIKQIPLKQGVKKFLKEGGADINDSPSPYWQSNLMGDEPGPIYNPIKKRKLKRWQ